MKELSSHPITIASTATRLRSSVDAPSTNQKTAPYAQENTTVLIGWILRGGVILSASITLLGILLLPLRSGGLSEHRILTFPYTLSQEWTALLTLHPQSLIVLGLLLLIATPVLSVAASVVAFAIERDRLYVVIALIVLSILLTSLFFGKGIS